MSKKIVTSKEINQLSTNMYVKSERPSATIIFMVINENEKMTPVKESSLWSSVSF
jgi:hypothetical protein